MELFVKTVDTVLCRERERERERETTNNNNLYITTVESLNKDTLVSRPL